jgi:LmbE family N-acetylglucosaminyl deacetylase
MAPGSAPQPDLVIDIDSVIEKKLDSFTCHVSQVEEWMPWMAGNTDEIPADPQARNETGCVFIEPPGCQ